MILKIKTVFDIDTELVDQINRSVSIDSNHVKIQDIELPEKEMQMLLSCLQFSSNTFKIDELITQDDVLIWEKK